MTVPKLLNLRNSLRRFRDQQVSYPLQQSIRLPMQVVAWGVELRKPPNYSWNGLKRGRDPFAVLQYSMAGCGELIWEGHRQPVPSGHLMLVTVPHDHIYRVPDDGQWEHCFLVVHGHEAMRAIAAIQRTLGPVIALPPEDPAIAIMTALIRALASRTGVTAAGASAQLWAMLTTLIDHGQVQLQASTAADQQALDAAAAWAEQHCAEPIKLHAMAQIAGMSDAHFIRRFQRRFGVTPGRYLLERRIDRACRRMHDEQLPLAQIARDIGFATPSAFARAFRRVIGMPPSRFNAR